MADPKKPTDALVDNFDDLLDLTADDTPVTEAPADTAPEDPEEARIRELEAMLSAPMPSFDVVEEPVELTAAQLRIKELEDKMAKRNAIIAENSPTQYAKAGDGEKFVIHFVYDGFVAFGENWYRGQELEFEIGGDAFKRTQDRTGKSWLDLANDPNAQIRRWGKHYFSPGPFVAFPGETFDDDMVAQDARRGRAVPLPRA